MRTVPRGRSRTIPLAFLLVAALPLAASGQTTVIRAARMFDPIAGVVTGPVVVVVEGDRIREVNPAAAPPGAGSSTSATSRSFPASSTRTPI